MVAICAPSLVFTCATDQRPNAAEPPARFMSITMAPRITRNTSMPTFQPSDSCPTMPSTNTCCSTPDREKPAYSTPPTRMPINSEEYTSLVISTSTMAMRAGSSDHAVFKTFIRLLSGKQPFEKRKNIKDRS